MPEDKDPAVEAERVRTVGQIISALLVRTTVPAGELPALIRSVHEALGNGVTAAAATREITAAPPRPAVPVRRSVRPDHIVCLECGAKQKTLKRHLEVAHGLSVEDYRIKWNLPKDYPMVAPDYAAQRSALAKQLGLGRQRAGNAEPAAEQSAPVPNEAPRRRGRRAAK